jgi:uncharacterized protein YggT (Ycf19 family)
MPDEKEQDRKLADDEARRISGHEQVKEEIRKDVQEGVARNAQPQTVTEEAKVKGVAAQLKDKAVEEVAGTEAEIDRARGAARTSQIVDYIFYIIYGIIGLEIILELLGARESSGFKQFIDVISMPLLAPFRSLLRDPAVGSSRFMFSYVMALVVWILVHFAVNGLLRLFVHKKTAV